MSDHDHDLDAAALAEPSGLGRFGRREFLRRSSIIAAAGVAAPFGLELAAMSRSAAADATNDDYRALVCLFLYGGNDHWNTFVPSDAASHAAYEAARTGLHVPRRDVLPIDPTGGFAGAGEFGFSPHLPRLHQMFRNGDAAVVANVGTLRKPVTKAEAQFLPNVPPQLRSHNDQQSIWQSSNPEGATTGWGGKIADLVLDGNGDGAAFTSITVRGNAVMMTGDRALQYRVSTSTVTQLRTNLLGLGGPSEALAAAMSLDANGPFRSAIADTSRRGLVAADAIADALAAVDDVHDLAAPFGGEGAIRGELTSRLHMVTRMIAAGRDQLGLRRQVFFVGIGGFDNHRNLADAHPERLAVIDDGLASFHTALATIGAEKQVTSFTASDFSRSLSANGSGSDHGWGGHQIVVGEAVAGNRVVGTVPTVALDGPDSFTRGDLVPTTSVDQYAATFAHWMGAGSNELEAIVPNIGRFESRDLGLFPGVRHVDRSADADRLQPARRVNVQR